MKDIVLEELRKNKDKYISGEQLSLGLGVSRTSIWKYVKKLKEDGYKIDSSTRKGYKLIDIPDALYPSEIKRLINTKIIGKELIFLDSIDSTNSYGKKISESDFMEGTVIITEEQTAGRGRLGREWVSPKGNGVYLSIMLKPDIKPIQATQITIIAAYAVAKTIRDVFKLNALIKWPNDIVINGRKVCGILTEMGAEIDKVNYLIVGIGINANIEKKQLSDYDLETATSLRIEIGERIDRKTLLSKVLTNFEKLYLDFITKLDIRNIIGNYKEINVTLGRRVRLISNKNEIYGEAIDINDLGQLVVKTDIGEIKEIVSGEVSVRGIYDYI